MRESIDLVKAKQAGEPVWYKNGNTSLKVIVIGVGDKLCSVLIQEKMPDNLDATVYPGLQMMVKSDCLFPMPEIA